MERLPEDQRRLTSGPQGNETAIKNFSVQCTRKVRSRWFNKYLQCWRQGEQWYQSRLWDTGNELLEPFCKNPWMVLSLFHLLLIPWRISCMHTLYFDHIHHHSNSSQVHSYSLTPPNFVCPPSPVQHKPIGAELSTGKLSWLTRVTPLEKTNSPFSEAINCQQFFRQG